MSAGQVLGSARAQLGKRKAVRAVQLRTIAYTYEQIAQSLLPCDDHRPNGRRDCAYCVPMYGSRAAAKNAVDRALAVEYAVGAESRERLRQTTLAQIDMVLARAMPESIDRSNPDRNESARVVARYVGLRMRLLGLEAPARIQITSELDEEIRSLVGQLEGTEA